MNKTIMIVDDDSFARLLLRRLLQSWGHNVIEAASGEEAIGRLEYDTPDLVITDLYMTGMDGMELTSRMRTDPRHVLVPVIMSSAAVDTATRRQARASGINFWLEKPVEAQRLRELTSWALTVGDELAHVEGTADYRAVNW